MSLEATGQRRQRQPEQFRSRSPIGNLGALVTGSPAPSCSGERPNSRSFFIRARTPTTHSREFSDPSTRFAGRDIGGCDLAGGLRRVRRGGAARPAEPHNATDVIGARSKRLRKEAVVAAWRASSRSVTNRRRHESGASRRRRRSGSMPVESLYNNCGSVSACLLRRSPTGRVAVRSLPLRGSPHESPTPGSGLNTRPDGHTRGPADRIFRVSRASSCSCSRFR
jgi:hypothetical protein